jgi:hypothetical protein
VPNVCQNLTKAFGGNCSCTINQVVLNRQVEPVRGLKFRMACNSHQIMLAQTLSKKLTQSSSSQIMKLPLFDTCLLQNPVELACEVIDNLSSG